MLNKNSDTLNDDLPPLVSDSSDDGKSKTPLSRSKSAFEQPTLSEQVPIKKFTKHQSSNSNIQSKDQISKSKQSKNYDKSTSISSSSTLSKTMKNSDEPPPLQSETESDSSSDFRRKIYSKTKSKVTLFTV